MVIRKHSRAIEHSQRLEGGAELSVDWRLSWDAAFAAWKVIQVTPAAEIRDRSRPAQTHDKGQRGVELKDLCSASGAKSVSEAYQVEKELAATPEGVLTAERVPQRKGALCNPPARPQAPEPPSQANRL